MNDYQKAKLSMAQRVDEVLSAQSSVYEEMQPMVTVASELKEKIVAIRNAAIEQAAVDVTEQTRKKREAEEKMIPVCVRLSGALYVIGFTGNSTVSPNFLSLTPNSFYSIDDNEKVTLASNLYNIAKQHSTELEEYGFDEQKIEQAGAAIENYRTLIEKPMYAIAVRKQKTGNLKELFAGLNSLLYDRLDKMMVLFKESHPAFYGEYRNARNVIMHVRAKEE